MPDEGTRSPQTSLRLLDLGRVSPLRSQTAYHATAYAMTETTPDTIILAVPDGPYVCIGYHQDPEQEVDLTYCRANELPVYRREVGGGAVYLDDGQLFLFWVFHPGHLPADLEERYALFARSLVETYRALGILAYHRPVNDIHVAGRKIGGTGMAQIGAADVVVGSLMFRFDRAAMARVLKVPSEKMRDKVAESLQKYMTTIAEEAPDLVREPGFASRVKDLYLEKCAGALGRTMEPGRWSLAEEAMALELEKHFTSEERLNSGRRARQHGIKIHEDVRLGEGAYKAPGGLIRATLRLRAGRVDDLALSGDFTLLPAGALANLEEAARGAEATPDALLPRLHAVYRTQSIRSPGVTPEDFAQAVLAAAAQSGATGTVASSTI